MPRRGSIRAIARRLEQILVGALLCAAMVMTVATLVTTVIGWFRA